MMRSVHAPEIFPDSTSAPLHVGPHEAHRESAMSCRYLVCVLLLQGRAFKVWTAAPVAQREEAFWRAVRWRKGSQHVETPPSAPCACADMPLPPPGAPAPAAGPSDAGAGGRPWSALGISCSISGTGTAAECRSNCSSFAFAVLSCSSSACVHTHAEAPCPCSDLARSVSCCWLNFSRYLH